MMLAVLLFALCASAQRFAYTVIGPNRFARPGFLGNQFGMARNGAFNPQYGMQTAQPMYFGTFANQPFPNQPAVAQPTMATQPLATTQTTPQVSQAVGGPGAAYIAQFQQRNQQIISSQQQRSQQLNQQAAAGTQAIQQARAQLPQALSQANQYNQNLRDQAQAAVQAFEQTRGKGPSEPQPTPGKVTGPQFGVPITQLLKEVVKTGNGAKPQAGQTVSVEYTGYLTNGQQFDASNGTPFTFKLGTGGVIQGVDYSVADMNIGERAYLYIPAVYGYGASGAAPTIPPNNDLIFDVTLLSAR